LMFRDSQLAVLFFFVIGNEWKEHLKLTD